MDWSELLLSHWKDLPKLAVSAAKQAGDLARDVQAVCAKQGAFQAGVCRVFANPERDQLTLVVGDWGDTKELQNFKQALPLPCKEATRWFPDGDEPSLLLWSEHFPSLPARTKLAYSSTLRRLGEAVNLLPNSINKHVPYLHSGIGSLLSGGLLGAGVGYGLGALSSNFLPEDWDKKRWKNRALLAGGLLGATPGMAWTATNLASGESPLSSWPLTSATRENLEKYYPAKAASSFTGFDAPTIDSTEIMRSLWADPFAQDRLPLPVRAAGTGLLLGASRLASEEPGKRTRFISPSDIGRMAAGMGSGYLSGVAVGRGLQLLTGMPPAYADKLKQTGVWAGALANLIPMAFPH